MENNTFFPDNQGLYNSDYEHDACGVGFVANIKGNASHEIVRDGLQILKNLNHRGATGSDPDTGDGAGILIQVPDSLIRPECDIRNIDLPPVGDYGIGMVFLPTIGEDRHIVENIIEHVVREEGQEFLGFRDVPFDDSKIGRVARSAMPVFKHLLVGRGPRTPQEYFERKLLVIRKKLGLKIRVTELDQKKYFYMCSLSSKVVIYKGQLKADQLAEFFPDLASESVKSAIALVHSRYSTNTFPTWALAHPYRMIAHNGEINTLRGNTNWFNVREKLFSSEHFGNDLEKVFPVIAPSKSDSAAFDNALEMLVASGRSLPHAVMMMIPEAHTGDKNMSEKKKAFYEYHSCLLEPWDGPATISFTDGRYIGSILDRNGLRPSRFWVTNDDRVIMASESGALEIPEKNIIKKGRLQPGKIFLVDTQEGRIIDDKEIKDEIVNQKPYSEWLKNNLVELSHLPEPEVVPSINENELKTLQKAFGYTNEDLKMILPPMAITGVEATGSMGADTPLAVLSDKPQLLFNYFKQLFAQVTNPPIDAIREEIIMSQTMFLGAEKNLLNETPGHCHRLKLERPIITNSELQKIKEIKNGKLKTEVLPILFEKSKGSKGLKKGLKNLFRKADKAIVQGNSLLVLSDREVDSEHVSIPSLLACAGLHHYLIRKGTRVKVTLIVETGEAREM
ncbi:MAG: glutamate synthase subunit alpha, partial [Melioribacteraceae bacterium]|nr:glutamate synthase subunit alpha [Melioribacteraceae bacterium]